MTRVLFGLSETSLVGFGPLLFHACQDTTLLPLGVPVGASSVLVVLIARRVDQRQGVMSQGGAQNAIGVTVIGGMTGATVIGLFVISSLYYAIQSMRERFHGRRGREEI